MEYATIKFIDEASMKCSTIQLNPATGEQTGIYEWSRTIFGSAIIQTADTFAIYSIPDTFQWDIQNILKGHPQINTWGDMSGKQILQYKYQGGMSNKEIQQIKKTAAKFWKISKEQHAEIIAFIDGEISKAKAKNKYQKSTSDYSCIYMRGAI